MTCSPRPFLLIIAHERRRLSRTTKRIGLVTMLGLALLAAPLGSATHASIIPTRLHSCDGPRWFKGEFPNTNGYNGGFFATLNFCDSAEYYNTQLFYVNNAGYYWYICDLNAGTSNFTCTPSYNTGSCPSPNGCFSPGQVYMQGQMYSTENIGPNLPGDSQQGPF